MAECRVAIEDGSGSCRRRWAASRLPTPCKPRRIPLSFARHRGFPALGRAGVFCMYLPTDPSPDPLTESVSGSFCLIFSFPTRRQRGNHGTRNATCRKSDTRPRPRASSALAAAAPDRCNGAGRRASGGGSDGSRRRAARRSGPAAGGPFDAGHFHDARRRGSQRPEPTAQPQGRPAKETSKKAATTTISRSLPAQRTCCSTRKARA